MAARLLVDTDVVVDYLRTFSRVGFDAARSRALVYESGQCGPRCGGIGLILLEREAAGRWRYARSAEGASYQSARSGSAEPSSDWTRATM